MFWPKDGLVRQVGGGSGSLDCDESQPGLQTAGRAWGPLGRLSRVGLWGWWHYCTMSVLQDEQKAEDELAKKRAAFLLKQQRKAEEARVRKQQLEAEVELKRDEAR